MASKSFKLNDNSYYIASAGGALVQFSALPGQATTDTGKLTHVSIKGKQADVMYWGENNDLPQYREELIIGNNIVPSIIERKNSIVCGQSWYAYRERFETDNVGPGRRIVDEVPMPPAAAAFFEQFKPVARDLVGEYFKHALMIPEFLRLAGGGIKVHSLEVKYMRMGRKDGPYPSKRWWWSNAWTQGQKRVVKSADQMLIEVPVYDPMAKKPQQKFILPLGKWLFNDGYYPIPAYWGGRHWINLSNIIPLFHEANLKHGQLPRWQIVIPHDYFYDYEAMQATTDETERAKLFTEFQAKEQAFVDDLNRVLTGLENAGRTIVTKSELEEAIGGKRDKRIEIIALDGKLNDDALLPLYAASNVANISAQGIHPTLANIETQGRLSSGTEIRNAYLLWLIIAAPEPRGKLYEIVNLVKKDQQWPPDIHYAIRDAELTTLAENPGGMQPAETPVGV